MSTINVSWFSIIASGLLGGIILTSIYYLRRLRFYKLASAISGPPTLPLVGNALHFLGNTEHMFNSINNLSETYSSPFRIWLGPELAIFLTQPEHIQLVLRSEKSIEKAKIYAFFRPWLGDGLICAPAAHWRVHRRLIEPTFNLKFLESFVDIFAARAKIMVDKMAAELNGNEFPVFDYLSSCTLTIICETAMGVNMEENTNFNSYVEAAEKTLGIVFQRIFKVWLHPDVIFNRTRLGREQAECIKTLHNFTDEVIRKKKEALQSRNRKSSQTSLENDTHYGTLRGRANYLDHLMMLSNDQSKFSDSEVREEVDTMVAAGNDTSANVICFVMLMLAFHPDIQEKVYQELCEIYGSQDIAECSVSHKDLPRMKYMERVIKETLRLFPVVPVIARTLTDDLDLGGLVLPEGSSVMINVFSVHRNDKYWHDPLKFNPDRFLPEENTKKRHPYSYLPFSAGPRNCIGSRFAMMEMKTIIATVLRKYILKKDKIVPISGIKLKSESVLKSTVPITLCIEIRSSKSDSK